jgi:hypothetical protein
MKKTEGRGIKTCGEYLYKGGARGGILIRDWEGCGRVEYERATANRKPQTANRKPFHIYTPRYQNTQPNLSCPYPITDSDPSLSPVC